MIHVKYNFILLQIDREKFGISKENKKNSQAAADFKNTKDLAAQLDEETKDNFYALLEYLETL